jgi:hypothetical protein
MLGCPEPAYWTVTLQPRSGFVSCPFSSCIGWKRYSPGLFGVKETSPLPGWVQSLDFNFVPQRLLTIISTATTVSPSSFLAVV